MNQKFKFKQCFCRRNFELKNVVLIWVLAMPFSVFAQTNTSPYIITHEDSLALEHVIVEKYYVADTSDYNNKSESPLPKGSVTYRIFIDMKPDYKLQMVYGDKNHELVIETSTHFFNDTEADAVTGFNVDMKKLNVGNIALDSWVTLGAACRGFTGIPRAEDTSKYSFISNRASLSKSDGLTKGVLPDFLPFNLDLTFFNNDSTAKRFATTNGAWAAPGGVKGPTPENRVLIAQLTTNGELSFQLNVQIGTPTGGYVKFVATKPLNDEIEFYGLSFNKSNIN
ncbi:MAG: hypothetical protein WCQ95_00355 [Bacteroidota bacterium]